MWYYGTVTRNGQTFYLTSPCYGVYELTLHKEGRYLWTTENEAKEATERLALPGDSVRVVRTYNT